MRIFSLFFFFFLFVTFFFKCVCLFLLCVILACLPVVCVTDLTLPDWPSAACMTEARPSVVAGRDL